MRPTSKQKKIEMLRSMLLSRRFEEVLTELCKEQGKIPGMMILCTGQEAVGSGVCAALNPEDVIISNHRSHNHLVAKGADPKALMAEIYGKRTGCNQGGNALHPGRCQRAAQIGQAEVKREGRDVTVVTWSKMLGVALRAAAQLAEEDGIDAEVVDLHTLAPLDKESVLSSVRKTGRLVVVHEATRTGGFAGEICAVVMEEAFTHLKAPFRRVTGPDIPVPYSPPLEQFDIPNEKSLVRAILRRYSERPGVTASRCGS